MTWIPGLVFDYHSLPLTMLKEHMNIIWADNPLSAQISPLCHAMPNTKFAGEIAAFLQCSQIWAQMTTTCFSRLLNMY